MLILYYCYARYGEGSFQRAQWNSSKQLHLANSALLLLASRLMPTEKLSLPTVAYSPELSVLMLPPTELSV